MLFGSFLGVGFTSMATTFGLWTLGTARFMFPNVLTEPPSKFKVGFPEQLSAGAGRDQIHCRSSACGWCNYEYNGKRRNLCLAVGVHALGLHAELARRRAEIQMPLPRQRFL